MFKQHQSCLNPNLILIRLLPLAVYVVFQFCPTASAIRKDVGIQHSQRYCRTSVQGRFFIADDKGRICDAFSLDPMSRCCPDNGEQFSCQACNLVSQCCKGYESCVSCCLNPSMIDAEQVLNVKIGKPITAGTYESVFDYCIGRCRHNSESVVHENAYLSDFHHCFSIPSISSGSNTELLETRLSGIKIIGGRQGESCDSVCKSSGQSCVPNKLVLLNQCEVIEKYMSCKGGCLPSIGAEQPAEVVDDAPKDLNPGACLYTTKQSLLSCDGSHRHTMRLCPCA